jgi:hypothetical protein
VHTYFDAIRRRDADAFRALFTAEGLGPDPGRLIVDGDRIVRVAIYSA